MDRTNQNTELPTDRGGGGKLRKPASRKPPASPYARPPPTDRRRWISKLVDPAYRIIADGATRFLPSFLSTPAASASALPSPPETTENQGKWQTGEQSNKDDLLRSDLNLLASDLSEIESTGAISGKLNGSFDFVLPRQLEKGEQAEKNKLSDIEQLVKGKKFTRNEVDHLVEVLNSRATNVSNVEQKKEHANLTSRQDGEALAVEHKLSKVSNDQRFEESKGDIWGSSTPLYPSKTREEIGASPVEIARAYMDFRTSEAGPSSKNMIQTIGSPMLCGDEAAKKPYDLSPLRKSSTCWPGAVVQDAYTTPQSQASRYGVLNHHRTPYSRTLLTKSKSKLINQSPISSTPLRQSQTTLYLQDKSEIGASSERRYGSVGPIRRSRHKVGVQSTPRIPAYSSMNTSQRESFGYIEGLNPTGTTSMDPAGTSGTCKPLEFEKGVPTVHMHTSLMAKKILEHIDRNVPTPKEKMDELKLATKWKNPESSVNISTILSNEDNGLVKCKDVSPCKYDGTDVKKSRNEDKGNCYVDIQPRENTDKSVDIRREGTLASDMHACSSIPTLGNGARTTQNFVSSQKISAKSSEKDVAVTIPSSSGSRYPPAANQQKETLVNNAAAAASKPHLPPISVKKPESRWNSASENSSGFTFSFPVTASSSVFSEPPTPSIMPLFSTGNQNQLNEKSTELSYSFGIKKSDPAIVFSFPSSNTAVNNDAAAINFNFGSTEKARLSFSFGKNAACC